MEENIFFNLLDTALLNTYDLYHFIAMVVESMCPSDDVPAAVELPSLEYLRNNITSLKKTRVQWNRRMLNRRMLNISNVMHTALLGQLINTCHIFIQLVKRFCKFVD